MSDTCRLIRFPKNDQMGQSGRFGEGAKMVWKQKEGGVGVGGGGGGGLQEEDPEWRLLKSVSPQLCRCLPGRWELE